MHIDSCDAEQEPEYQMGEHKVSCVAVLQLRMPLLYLWAVFAFKGAVR